MENQYLENCCVVPWKNREEKQEKNKEETAKEQRRKQSNKKLQIEARKGTRSFNMKQERKKEEEEASR